MKCIILCKWRDAKKTIKAILVLVLGEHLSVCMLLIYKLYIGFHSIMHSSQRYCLQDMCTRTDCDSDILCGNFNIHFGNSAYDEVSCQQVTQVTICLLEFC